MIIFNIQITSVQKRQRKLRSTTPYGPFPSEVQQAWRYQPQNVLQLECMDFMVPGKLIAEYKPYTAFKTIGLNRTTSLSGKETWHLMARVVAFCSRVCSCHPGDSGEHSNARLVTQALQKLGSHGPHVYTKRFGQTYSNIANICKYHQISAGSTAKRCNVVCLLLRECCVYIYMYI